MLSIPVLTVFSVWRSRKTVSFEEQIMSKDKYRSIFSPPNGGYRVYYPSNLFRNASCFENWGIFLDIYISQTNAPLVTVIPAIIWSAIQLFSVRRSSFISLNVKFLLVREIAVVVLICLETQLVQTLCINGTLFWITILIHPRPRIQVK